MAGEGPPVLPLHHRRSHRRDALRLHTRRITFRSDRSLAVTSPAGDVVAQVPYKVAVPLQKINRVRPSESADKPEHKYIQVVVDSFEFWFMGFVSYQRCCKYMVHLMEIAGDL